ncbi:hypothetical protein ES707_01307 [subsurface metagenome]
MANLRDYLCQLLGCGGEYEELYRDAAEGLIQCSHKKQELKETIRQLELLVPRPTPPTIDYVVEKDSLWVQQRLDGMGLEIIRLPLDGNYRLTNRKNFLNVVSWDITDRMEYVRDFFDCDKFAMLFKVMVNLVFRLTQVAYIIDYKSGHSYDLILYPDSESMVHEPQSDGMYVWTKRLTDFYSLRGAIALI